MGESQKIIDLKGRINNDDFRMQEAVIKANKRKDKTYAPRRRKKKFSIINVIFLLFLVYVASTVFNQMQMMKVLDAQIADRTEERDAARKKAEELKSDVEKINNEATKFEIYEKVARDEYKMVKPNETIYIDKSKNSNKFIKGIGSGIDEYDEDEQ